MARRVTHACSEHRFLPICLAQGEGPVSAAPSARPTSPVQRESATWPAHCELRVRSHAQKMLRRDAAMKRQCQKRRSLLRSLRLQHTNQ
eukprot:453098-Pleurochrysis_carterae.AAC.1